MSTQTLRDKALYRLEEVASKNRELNKHIPSEQIDKDILDVVMDIRKNS